MNELSSIEDTATIVREKLEQLGLQFDHSKLPYRLDKMFPKTKGWGAKGDIKKKVKLIKQLEPILPDALMEGEEVFYIAKGIQHSWFEAISIGALWSNLINQTVFVLTNLRVLMFHTTSSGKPLETCWQIYYSEIKVFKKSVLSTVLKLKLNDRKSLQFTGFSKLDKTAMPQIFEEALQMFKQLDFAPECSQSREDICGRCYKIVPKGTFKCDTCETEFWKPSQLAVRSLIVPSWGDFLMKHRLLGCVETVGCLLGWIVAISLIAEGEVFVALLVIAFTHGLDAVVTWVIANKGLHPIGKLRPASSSSQS